jgi:hypothetical protein
MPTPSSLREEASRHRDLSTRARLLAANLHQRDIKSDFLDQALELEEKAQDLEDQATAIEAKND